MKVSYLGFSTGCVHKEFLEGHGRNVNFSPFHLQLSKEAMATL